MPLVSRAFDDFINRIFIISCFPYDEKDRKTPMENKHI